MNGIAKRPVARQPVASLGAAIDDERRSARLAMVVAQIPLQGAMDQPGKRRHDRDPRKLADHDRQKRQHPVTLRDGARSFYAPTAS
jgi:hypothetical protein